MPNPFVFSNIEHVVLLGASPIFPALNQWGADNGVRFTVITSPDQAAAVDASLKPIVVERLDESLKPHVKRAAFAISFGARWIMKRPIRQTLFYDQVANCHGTRLPFDKGGGSWSYRVMRSDRIGSLTLHVVDDGIDTGPILAQETYAIPRTCQTPAEVRDDYVSRLLPFITGFIGLGLNKSATVIPTPQPQGLGTYYPRLATQENGRIDWSAAPHDVERFILAFDAPYPGAITTLHGADVHLRGCQLHGGEPRTHSSQAGTVLRVDRSYFVVALRDGWSLLVEDARSPIGEKVSVREGDVLGATSPRVKYTAAGRS